MERKPQRTYLPVVSAADRYPWAKPLGFPSDGANRDELLPVVQEAFLGGIARHGWNALGQLWEHNPAAFDELSQWPPEGVEAMARFQAKHFCRELPATGISETEFWDRFFLFNLRACHDWLEDEWLRAYLSLRTQGADLLPFLRRLEQAATAKETPEIAGRMTFCVLWDLFILPLRFWADEAAAELLSVSGAKVNLDKIRNTRRDLGLRRGRPIVVRRFQRLPAPVPGELGIIELQLDADAAKRAGLSAMLTAFLAFMKTPGIESGKAD